MVEAKLWVWSPATKIAVIGFPSNAAFQLSFNGAEILNTHQPDYLVRPGQQGPASHYAQVTLRQGWNEVALRIERHDHPVDAYLLFTDPTDLHRHLTDIVLTQSP